MLQNKQSKITLIITTVLTLCILHMAIPSMGQNTPDDYFNKGYNYLTVDKTEAINYFDKCLELDQNYVAAYHMRGLAKYKLGNYRAAIEDFTRAVSLNKNLAIAYLFQGYAYRNLGDTENALLAFKKYTAAKSAPSNLDYKILGKAQLSHGDIDEAIETFSNIPDTTSNETQFFYRYLAYHEAGRFEEAVVEINKAIEVNQSFYGYYLHRGQSYYMAGQFESSIEDYSKAIRLSDGVADCYYLRGLALDTLGQVNEAINDFTQAISLNPEDGSYYSKRGNAKYELGNREAACLDWTIAGKFGYYEDFDKIKSVCE